MKESYDFDNAGVRPIRASGTRWISHKIGTMTRILDKFGLYITHLENVATDTSYRAKERNQIKGYLNKWKNSKMLVNLCFYLELLKPLISDVSRSFGSPVYWFGHPNSGAQKRFFNFLFFCCNSTKKYVEEVKMA